VLKNVAFFIKQYMVVLTKPKKILKLFI